MQIREAQLHDCDEVVDLWHRAGLTRPWNDPVLDFRRALATSSSTVLIGEESTVTRPAAGDVEVVGTVMVGHDGHRGWLYYLAVHEGYRGAGRGRQLVAAGEGWLRDQGAVAVRLMVRHDNNAVVRFYTALGYQDQDCTVLGRAL